MNKNELSILVFKWRRALYISVRHMWKVRGQYDAYVKSLRDRIKEQDKKIEILKRRLAHCQAKNS